MEPTQEGSPILLAKKRTLSFPDRKIVMGSTPVHEETSNVLRAFGQSDARIFEAPCPECGAFAEILWEAIVWDEDRPETARWICPHCAAGIAEREKPAMVAAGTRPFIEPSRSGKARAARLWLVGVDGIKASLTARLVRPGSIRFSADLPPVWFEQLASERLVVRYSRGQPQRRFERIPGRRAEALDCVVYALAARQVVHINFEEREAQLRAGGLQDRPKPANVIRSKFVTGGG